MSIKLKGSSDGSVSLDAPADTSPTGTDISFTLPTADGTSGQVLTTNGSGALSFANEGKILQVVQGTFTSKTTTTSSTYVDTGLSVAITPTSSSSKVLIMTSFLFGQIRTPNLAQNNMKTFTLVRGSTNLAPGNSRFFAHQDQASGSINWSEQTQVCAINYLDSPSTTSATTYKLQMKTDFSGTEIYFNTRANGNGDHQGSSTILVMEVA